MQSVMEVIRPTVMLVISGCQNHPVFILDQIFWAVLYPLNTACDFKKNSYLVVALPLSLLCFLKDSRAISSFSSSCFSYNFSSLRDSF